MVEHLNLLPGVAARLAAESPFGAEIDGTTAVAMAATLAALVAGCVVLTVSVRQFKRAVWPERFGLVAAPTAGREAEPLAIDREALFVATLAFWFAVLAINLVAFVFTTAVIDVFGSRYLVPGWIALCVLMPLLAVRANVRWLAGRRRGHGALRGVDPQLRAPSQPDVRERPAD